MSVKHVFVETNWVVDFVAPTISREQGARSLLERARCGELQLHVPAIALSEARKVVRERNPRADLDNIRAFIHDSRGRDELDEPSAKKAFDLLSRFQQHLAKEKLAAPERIADLPRDSAIDVFHLDEEMLERSTQIAAETGLGLQSFDLAIVAAVLVRGATLHTEGSEVCFCTLDSDLHPWDRNGKRKDELAALFDDAGIWVYRNFLLATPPRPPAEPAR